MPMFVTFYEALKQEEQAIRLYCEKYGLTYKPFGHETQDSRPDFLVNGKPVEVKCSNAFSLEMWIKPELLDSYIAHNAHILWVFDIEHDPEFTVIRPKTLRWLKEKGRPVKRWHRNTVVKGNYSWHTYEKRDFYVFSRYQFEWKSLV